MESVNIVVPDKPWVADVIYVHASAFPSWRARVIYALKLLLGAPLHIDTKVYCSGLPGRTEGETGVDIGAVPWWPRRAPKAQGYAHP